MTTFFTADTHFGDHRTINIQKRPFGSVAEMDEALVASWNAAVAPGDEVWHLGDVARRAADVPGILARLHGRKHLIRGNNDPDATLAAAGWASVGDYAELDLDGRRLVLCHYPFRSWNGQHRGTLNLHGHSHGRLKAMPQQFDVGVDARAFAPVTLAQLAGTPPARNVDLRSARRHRPAFERALVAEGIMTAVQLADAVRQSRATGASLATTIVRTGLIRQRDLLKLIERLDNAGGADR